MNREMQLIRAVALQADAISSEAEDFGRRAAGAITGDAGNRQIKGLESIAASVLKVSDVLDYIKRQTAKCKKDESWRKGDFGVELLKFISEDLRRRCDDVAQQLGAAEAERQRIYLLLIREFVRQMAAHYAFVPLAEGERR
jgi:hypothetical protein